MCMIFLSYTLLLRGWYYKTPKRKKAIALGSNSASPPGKNQKHKNNSPKLPLLDDLPSWNLEKDIQERLAYHTFMWWMMMDDVI